MIKLIPRPKLNTKDSRLFEEKCQVVEFIRYLIAAFQQKDAMFHRFLQTYHLGIRKKKQIEYTQFVFFSNYKSFYKSKLKLVTTNSSRQVKSAAHKNQL